MAGSEEANTDDECPVLPTDWRTRPPEAHELPAGYCVIICDASHKDTITGISVTIRFNNEECGPFECTARSKGPVHAELTAVQKALAKLKLIKRSRAVHTVVIYTDSKYACNFLESAWNPKRPYIKGTISKIADTWNEINDGNTQLIICHTRTKFIRRIDRRATRKRKEEQGRKLLDIRKRVEHVEAAIVRGRDIHVDEVDDIFLAYPISGGSPPGYKVGLDPPSCECAWWRLRWANKGTAIINARALPCKHMCALAEHLSKDIYDIFEHQIHRVD